MVFRVALVVLALLCPITAWADPPPAASGDGAQAPGPDITPPAPDAPPAKVKEAKEVAQTAALTPIVPNPDEPTRPAFLLYAEIDPPVLAVGFVFAYGRRYKTEPAFCAPACSSGQLNTIDKWTAGFYSAGWSRASDYMLYGLGTAAAGLLLFDEGFLPALNDAVVVGEATLSATAVASIMTLAAGRPRPFLYGDPNHPDSFKAPLSVRNSGNANLSYLSSHTAEAFAMATSLYIAQRRLHPRSRFPLYVLGAGLGVASAIGVARVMAGYHFITDVIGGAFVGSSLGVLIASVHGSPVSVVPVLNKTPEGGHASGLALSGRF